MGYTTKFKGTLKFKNPITVDQLKVLSPLLGEEWPGGYVQFELTKAMDGIKWDGSEKFYDAPATVDWLTEQMREQWPDFAFTGELQAQGEDIDDRWRLVVGEDGKARKVTLPPPGKKIECPHCRRKFYLTDDGAESTPSAPASPCGRGGAE
jgi:hypothetical protein